MPDAASAPLHAAIGPALEPRPEAFATDRPALSEQANLLHVRALEVAIRTGAVDLIGRVDADRLAALCGALVDELVDAGFWLASDVGYRIRSGTLRTLRRR